MALTELDVDGAAVEDAARMEDYLLGQLGHVLTHLHVSTVHTNVHRSSFRWKRHLMTPGCGHRPGRGALGGMRADRGNVGVGRAVADPAGRNGNPVT